MKHLLLLVVLCVAVLHASVQAKEQGTPYIGDWSNGRGETLIITATTVRFGKDKPVPYRDITRASDGNTFHLQISVNRDTNYFSKFMTITLKGRNRIGTESYDQWADQGGENNSVQTWERD